MVKHLPTMWETRVWSLGWEDLLEKEMATHSSTLAWRIPWTEETGRLQSMGSQRVRHDWVTSLSLSKKFYLAMSPVESQFPNQWLKLHPLHWKQEVITTGPPTKPLTVYFRYIKTWSLTHVRLDNLNEYLYISCGCLEKLVVRKCKRG